MKRFLVCVLTAALLAGGFVGCASDTGAVKKYTGPVPKWFMNLPKDDNVIYGVGTANLATVNMSSTMAEQRAFVSLARKISVVSKSMIEDYIADSSEVSGKRSDVEAFAQNVSRTLSEAKIVGAKVVKQEQTKDGSWWVLVSYDKKDAERLALDTINKEKLNYAQTKNWDAQKNMDEAFAKQKNSDTELVSQ
jgi:hypothetical protein